MEKSASPALNPLGAMGNSLELVRKLWSGMGVPGMAAPSLSVDEINKKIADLKTVESWLTLNMNMLRGTIQALEVQSGTLAALQSIGSVLGGAAPVETPPPFESPFAPPSPAEATAARPATEFPRAETGTAAIPGLPDPGAAPANPAAWWNLVQEQFQHAVGQALAAGAPAPAAAAAPASGKADVKPKAAARPKGGAKPASRRKPG